MNYGPKFFPTATSTEQRGVEDSEQPSLLPSIYNAEHASDSTYSNVSKDEEDSGLD